MAASPDIKSLKIGEDAPLFSLYNQKGELIQLENYRNRKNILLIFYPGDDTPGCTRQLCALRDDFSQFAKEETIILGVNPADDNSHQKFINKYHLPFDLLIDADHKVSAEYDAIKYVFGRQSIQRSVVLIDKQGKIIYLKRGMPTDAEILAALKTLK